MAIIRPGPLAGALSGKLGGLVFVSGQGTPFVRPRPAPRSKRQRFLAPSKTYHARLVSEWRDKDDEDRAAWATAAAAVYSTNRLGTRKSLTGFQYWIMVNKTIFQTKNTSTSDPPFPRVGLPPTSLALNFEVSGIYEVSATKPLGASFVTWQIFGWPFFTNKPTGSIPRPVFLRELTGTLDLDATVRTQWQEHFGPVQVGQHFSIEVRGILSAYPFPHKLRLSGIAVA